MMQFFLDAAAHMRELVGNLGIPLEVDSISRFLDAFDLEAQHELRGQVRDGVTRQVACHILPKDATIARIAEAARLPISQAKLLCIELWRICEELRSPTARGSSSVPDGMIKGVLGLGTPLAPQLSDYAIVNCALISYQRGSLSDYSITDNAVYLAAKVFVLSNGGRCFPTFEDYVEAARREKWPGVEQLLAPYQAQLDWLKPRVSTAIPTESEGLPFRVMGLFDNVNGAFSKRSLWIIQRGLRDIFVNGSDVWSYYPISHQGQLGERDCGESSTGLWLVQWRLPRRLSDKYELFSRSTGQRWQIELPNSKLIRHEDIENRDRKEDAARFAE